MKRGCTLLRKILILIGMMLSSFAAVHADKVVIAGKVVDQESNPIEFGTVRMAGTAIGTNTDLDGKYTLTVAERDTIKLIFSCIGFKNVERELVHAKGSVLLNVKMFPEATELAEIEVTGFRQNTNGMQNIDSKGFKLSPDVSGGSVEALVSSLAGVNSNNEMSSQYSVRGGSFDENSVYINGVEIYRPQLVRSGQQEGLSIINPDMVGNIGFSSGGFPARYADKMSSALDITYREPEALELSGALSLMGGSLAFGQSSEKFSQLHGARFKRNNSLLSSLETRGEYDPVYFDYQTNVTYKPTRRLSVNFLGNISLNHFNFRPSDRETSFGTAQDTKHFKVYFDGGENDRFETYLGAFTLGYKASAATSFEAGVSAFLTNEFVSYDISGEYWLNMAGTSGAGGGESVGGELGVGKYMEHSRNRLRASVLQTALRGRTAVGRHNLTYGLIHQREKFHDRTKEWEWRDSAGYSLPTQPDGVHLIYNLSSRQDVSASRIALFAEDAIRFESKHALMSLNGGIRVSYWDFNKEVLISPRVNFNFSPIENASWNYRIGAGIYYQSPFYKEYRAVNYDPLGNGYITLNRNIRSPRSMQLIGAADYTFRAMDRPFKLTGEAYFKHLSNLISYEYDNLKINYSGQNDAKGYIAGMDFKLFGQFVEGSDSWITFSLMKTNQTLHGKNVPLPSDQRYSFGMYFTDYFPKYPKLKFSLKGVLSDGLTMTAPHVTRDISYFRAPAYKRVDVGLSYQLVGAPEKGVRAYNIWRHFKDITVALDLFNLFDISNVSSYYWVTDVNDIQYAVPNYLTRRQINLRLNFTL